MAYSPGLLLHLVCVCVRVCACVCICEREREREILGEIAFVVMLQYC